MTDQPRVEGPVVQLAQRLTERFESIYSALDGLAAGALEMLEPRFAGRELGPFNSDDLERLRDLSYRVLDAHPEIAGAGIIFAVDRIAASDQTIQWHVRGDKGYEPYGFVYDDHSSEFYDFMQLPWYDEPRRTGGPALAGPYLDFLGVDEYVITCSVPVNIDGTFAGAASADIEVRSVERVFLQLARGVDDDVALTNAEGRIICANSSRFLPGDPVPIDKDLRVVDLSTRIPTLRLFARKR